DAMYDKSIKYLSKLIFKPASLVIPAQYTRFLYNHNLKKHYQYPKKAAIEKQNLEIYSQYDYVLKGTWYKHQDKSEKLIFLVPGYATIQLEVDYLAPFFLNLGYDVITYNLYAYGAEHALITFGNHESEDLKLLYDEILNHSCYQTIGLYGHSLGANT